MTVALDRLTLEDYLHYDDGTDTLYELVNGELTAMALGTGQHGSIAKFLVNTFDAENGRLNREWTALQASVAIQSPRGDRWDTARIPDITIIPKEQWRELQKSEAIIHLNENPPLLVVEVVSASTKTVDYRAKRAEYCVLDIPEYWVVDPLQERVTVFTWDEGWYDEAIFTGGDRIISPTFSELELNCDRVLQGET
ncbi:Uma2 family endonuclease [Roseofilum casamattae]|uniref:Uma2 family endonuclease n=1 Tax=Roseofilum casamattae BLCC-M143 TaxID=3022442 RepID=A0ABT7C217_9CYAN|nr:Uma2 family endonuclease [Roseofilum casamattae]MDJ1185330.1 Uma2 family endonuclease [Roseofilum casamattae BLCC-M143]